MRPIERLAAIEARAQSATSGQWSAGGGGTHRHARADVPFLVAALREAWAELDAALADRDGAEARMTNLFEQVEAMRDVLRSIEWEGDQLACPCCKRQRCSTGHASDCALAACLRGAK